MTQSITGNQRAAFHAEALEALRATSEEVLARVPELQAIQITCLWDFPDQAGIPASTVHGPLDCPDKVLRLQQALARVQRHLAQLVEEDAAAVRAAAASVQTSHAQTSQEAARRASAEPEQPGRKARVSPTEPG